MPPPVVILYGHRGCPGSDAAQAYFTQHRIPYQLRDVIRESEAAGELRNLGGWATPMICVGAEVLLGFDPQVFRAAYQRAARQTPDSRESVR